MYTKRFIALAVCVAMLLGMSALPARAEGEEPAPDITPTEAPIELDASVPELPEDALVDDGSGLVDAALCARVLRAGPASVAYGSWLRTLAHVPSVCITQKVGRAILKCALGLESQTPSDAPLYLVQCSEAPLPGKGVDSYKSQHFNLHGSIYSNSPITSITVSVRHRAIMASIYPVEAKLTFDPSENRLCCGLDEEVGSGRDAVSLSGMMKFNKLKNGKHSIAILATTTADPEPVTLYEANFEVLNEKPTLTSNAFRDNYSTALRFFGGDTSKFLMKYTWRSAGKRDINTNEAWRTANITKSSLGRVHVDAVENFEQANDYLHSTYLRVSVPGVESKVIQLAKLVEGTGTYVPRFQSDLRLISHHTFGTAIDVNHTYDANLNKQDNWALIGGEVRDHLVYNGIQTDESGQEFYDFSYDGGYGPKLSGVPKSIVNYLLYELAFFRAGFNWGYYYDHTCDAMHFSLTDGEHYRHMDSEIGLRKVFAYYN